MVPARLSRLVRGVTVLTVAGLAAACSSPSTAARPVRTSAVAPGSSVPFDLARNARADVSTSPCRLEGGRWVLQGTVANRTAGATSFQIVVDFVTQPGSTVVSTVVVDVPDVAAHGSKAWSASMAAGTSRLACLVRQAEAT